MSRVQGAVVVLVLLVGLECGQQVKSYEEVKPMVKNQTEGKLPWNEYNPDSGKQNSSEEQSSEELNSVRNYHDFYRIMYGLPEHAKFIRKNYEQDKMPQARAKVNENTGAININYQANAHFARMQTRGLCQVPIPQVVRVKNIHPDLSKEYLPRCTVLHRCGEGSGCCREDGTQCLPSEIQEVALPFYVMKVGKRGLSETKVEKLLFENHTACHCRPINDMPRMQQYPQVGSKCTKDCPFPFSSRVFDTGRCGCDCYDKQKSCIKIKRGKEALPDIEKRCIQENHCLVPECEFGFYNPYAGSCPKKREDRIHKHRD